MRNLDFLNEYDVKNNWLRLLIVAFISLTCLATVYIWFDLTSPARQGTANQEPIAIIKQIRDDVDRRPVKRQVWQNLSKGEYIYSGEAIRTSKDSEVQVEFIDGARSINIEPDSIVILVQNSNKELALDLMEGGASIVSSQSEKDKKESPDESAINLIQNGKSISIKGNAILTKSGSGGLEIQSSEISQEINAFFVSMQDSRLMPFKLNSPSKDKLIFTEGDAAAVKISWGSVPKDLLVKIAFGTQRSLLNQIREIQPYTSNSAELTLAAGYYFYKMYFINPTTQKIVAESKMQRIKVLERNMPVVVNPTLNQTFVLNESQQRIQFNWTQGEFARSYLLEIFKDSQLKNKVFTKLFEKNYSHEIDLPIGDYFYRLSAKFETENKLIQGRIEKFSLLRKALPEPILAPPIAVLPPPVTPPTKIDSIAWIQANYLDDQGAEDQKYIGDPELEMKWEPTGRAKISEYRIKIKPMDQSHGKTQELKSSQANFKAKMLKPGRYIASVEGVDQSKKIIAISDPKTFVISELELLVAPDFVGGNKLVASKKGDFLVKWQYLDGAYRYKINLIDQSGKLISSKTTDSSRINQISFEDMSPGDYRVEVAGIDRGGRLGAYGRKTVNVTDASDLNAPKLKKLKVK